MLVTITEFRGIATDADGNDLPIGGQPIAGQSVTADGNATALNDDTQVIRVASDTGVTLDIYGFALFLPAGGVEFFHVAGGETIAVATVA